MLDETIITETPPLYSAYGHIGVQVRDTPSLEAFRVALSEFD